MYKKFFFLLLILVVNGFSWYVSGMQEDKHESFITKSINENDIVSATWHPIHAKLALGGNKGALWIVDAQNKASEKIGSEDAGVYDLGWTCDGNSLESRKSKVLYAWKKNQQGKWFSTCMKCVQIYPKKSSLNTLQKINNDGNLIASIVDKTNKVTIDNVHKSDSIPLFTLSFPEEERLPNSANCYRSTIRSLPHSLAWGPKNILAILLHRYSESIGGKNFFLDYDATTLNGTINIYVSAENAMWIQVATIGLKIPGNGHLLWNPNGKYLACLNKQAIELIEMQKFLTGSF